MKVAEIYKQFICFATMINYNNKKFRATATSANGDVTEGTVFVYLQDGNMVTATYTGGNILSGHLIAIANADGHLDMRYHHINTSHILMTGHCSSIPEILENGKIKLHEEWQWTSGDHARGESILEEI